MAETRSDALFLGCNGGRIYLFDGVRAELSLAIDDTRIFSLLWAAPDGSVWAGAQSGYDADATTQLYRFDGRAWTKIGGDDERLLLLTGSPDGAVWTATATELRRFHEGTFTASFTPSTGELRACSFAGSQGYCVGTAGLAVTWTGQEWRAMEGTPWTANAEVFGVEIGAFDGPATFFYGEPLDESHNGDVSVHATKWNGATFSSHLASTTASPYYDVSRTRTSQVSVSGRGYMLLALDARYGRALLFDPYKDEFRSLCGPVLAFSAGPASTRTGGFNGFVASIVGTGGDQVALVPATDAFEFSELSVGSDGTAWARIEDTTACGSFTQRLVRFVDGQWNRVPAPEAAQSGHALAALSRDRAFTIDLADESLLAYSAGEWSDVARVPNLWSLAATAYNDVWIGGYEDGLAHFDGADVQTMEPGGRRRQILQTVPDGSGAIWMVALGYAQDDTDTHVYRRAEGKLTEWNLGIPRRNVQISAIDATHAWMSGAPAKAWDGTRWKNLPFQATGVWARTVDDVYFTDAGDIHRWDGRRRERVYQGYITIRFIGGTASRGFAVGPGGLTIELSEWPTTDTK